MKLSALLFKTVVASEEFDHLEAPESNDKEAVQALDGKEKPVSPEAEDAHQKFAGVKFAGYYQDYLQEVLTKMHEGWEQGESLEDFLKKLPTEEHTMLFALSKLNYQVGNGGFQQWISNGYAGKGQGDLLMEKLPDEGVLGSIKSLLGQVLDALNEVDPDGDYINSFDAAEDVLNKSYNIKETWEPFYNDHRNDLRIIGKKIDGEVDSSECLATSHLVAAIRGSSDDTINSAGECTEVLEALEQMTPESLNLSQDEYDTLEEGLDDLEGILKDFEEESNQDGGSNIESYLDKSDDSYYASTRDEEAYFQAVANFLETMQPVVSSLKQAFKVGSSVAPRGGRSFRVTSAANTADDIKIQATFEDGTTEVLGKTQLAALNLAPNYAGKLATLMITAYNKDFDLYVKTAIEEAGLPVDQDMNWSSYLERLYKKVSPDQDIRDEAAHHMIIYHLYELQTLNKFDPTKAPDQQNEKDKQVTTFLKKMFSYSVSKAREWVRKYYGQGTEVQPEVGEGDETFNLMDTEENATTDDHSDFESNSDLQEFKSKFYPWLLKKWGKIVGPNLKTLFELTLKHEDSDELWSAFQEATGKSFSYYKKAVQNLRSSITDFIASGKIDASNVLTRLVNDYTKKLVSIEEKTESKPEEAKESSEKGETVMAKAQLTAQAEPKKSRLAQLIEAKKASAEAAKTAASKFATLKKYAEEEPEAVAEAVAELFDLFQESVEGVEALAENLDINPEAAGDEEKFASAFKRIAEEEPEEVGNALNELYSRLDLLAGCIENLADNLGVELETEFELGEEAPTDMPPAEEMPMEEAPTEALPE